MTLSSNQQSLNDHEPSSLLLDTRRKQVDEYCKMEEKQANLCFVLASIYNKLQDDNKLLRLCDQQELKNAFKSIIQLELLAKLVHDKVAQELKERLLIWYDKKAYFGDILQKYVQFYKAYKAILQEYQQARMILNELLKRPKFSQHLQKLLKEEAHQLGNIDRLDIHLDQIVNLPRRYAQLLQNYIKHTNVNTEEYVNISKALEVFQEIFNATDNRIDREVNFLDCYKLQEQIEPHIELINANSHLQRQLIKQGQLRKISKKSGEHLQRYLILFDDLLLICHITMLDKIRRKFNLKYRIDDVSTITIIEHSDSSNTLVFRLISPYQNDEFIAEDTKEKESWMKSFKKLNKLKFELNYKIDGDLQIGLVPPGWHRDNTTNNCADCRVAFSTIRRRHHCRTCGKIFCGTCSNFFTHVKFDNYRSKQRVCKTCFNYLNSKQFEIQQSSQVTNGNHKSCSDCKTKRKSDYSSSFDEESASFDSREKCEIESDDESVEEEYFDVLEEPQVASLKQQPQQEIHLEVPQIRLSLNRRDKIELFGDYISVCKNNSLLIDETNLDAQSTFKPLIEKQYIRLFDDGTIHIFGHKSHEQPINVINLNTFELVNDGSDSMLQLKKRYTPAAPLVSSSSSNLKSRLSIFEYNNYEFNLISKEKKQIFMSFISKYNAAK